MTRRLAAIAFVALAISLAFGSPPGWAASRAHVYLFRGLADIFSTGMDVLTDELNRRGVYATSHSHTDWKPLADQAAANYKAGKEGPIILVGHSLGADAVMEMADYLGDRGVPVALVMPFDGTQSFPASANISRVVNFTQRDYAYMRRGPGFRGTLVNVDVSSDPNIGHLNIDKSPRLHARAIAEVLAVAAGHMGLPVAEKPNAAPPGAGAARREMSGRDEEQREPARPVPMGALVGGTPAGTPAGPEAARGVAPSMPARQPEISVAPPPGVAPAAPAAPASSGRAGPGSASSGFAAPVFPPQPPPVRLAPPRPLDIPD
ncbi:MAG TPA: thioesterase domain-containing protein [Xanthobacteraceae bacterium]|nr:thioesterase domain-containing protein [Xanthobacteraceae bacterium]